MDINKGTCEKHWVLHVGDEITKFYTLPKWSSLPIN